MCEKVNKKLAKRGGTWAVWAYQYLIKTLMDPLGNGTGGPKTAFITLLKNGHLRIPYPQITLL